MPSEVFAVLRLHFPRIKIKHPWTEAVYTNMPRFHFSFLPWIGFEFTVPQVLLTFSGRNVPLSHTGPVNHAWLVILLGFCPHVHSVIHWLVSVSMHLPKEPDSLGVLLQKVSGSLGLAGVNVEWLRPFEHIEPWFEPLVWVKKKKLMESVNLKKSWFPGDSCTLGAACSKDPKFQSLSLLQIPCGTANFKAICTTVWILEHSEELFFKQKGILNLNYLQSWHSAIIHNPPFLCINGKEVVLAMLIHTSSTWQIWEHHLQTIFLS